MMSCNKLDSEELKKYLYRKGLPFDKSNFGCVGPSCTHSNGKNIDNFPSVANFQYLMYVDNQFVDMIFNKLKIDPDKVSPEQKKIYLSLLRNLNEEDIGKIRPLLWDETNSGYSKLLTLFTKLKIPYITDNRGMIMNNYGRL